MAATTSADIAIQKDKLGDAETKKKRSEEINVTIGQLTSNEAKVTNIQITGPGTGEFLIIDENEFDVSNTAKSFTISLLTNKKIELDAEVQQLLQEVDSQI